MPICWGNFSLSYTPKIYVNNIISPIIYLGRFYCIHIDCWRFSPSLVVLCSWVYPKLEIWFLDMLVFHRLLGAIPDQWKNWYHWCIKSWSQEDSGKTWSFCDIKLIVIASFWNFLHSIETLEFILATRKIYMIDPIGF